MSNFDELLVSQLKAHEGLSLTPYQDTGGNWTIGWGHSLKKGISLEIAHKLLTIDMIEALEELNTHKPWWRELPLNGQLVVADMMFNLGWPKFKEFVKFWTALELGNYRLAADEMVDSRWYRQVKTRGVKLVKMMRDLATTCNH